MAITPLPTPPSRQRPVEFSSEADTFLGALPTFGTEANALAVDVNNKQVTATEAADTATAKALAAATSASNALISANQAATSAGEAATSASEAEYSAVQASKLNLGPKPVAPTTDNQGEPLLQGATYYDTVFNKWKVWNGVNWVEGLSVEAGVASLNGLTGELTGFVTETATQTLSQKTLENPLITLNGSQGTAGNVPISQGTGLPPIWGIASEIKVIDRTSNVIITSDNRTNLVNISSGTFTQTFDSANTLGNGWWCYLRNSGDGDITLSPNSPNTIDGLSSYIMYPGEMRLILSDGTNLHSVVIKSFYKVFTTSGNFIKPPGYTRFSGLLWGGGGGGIKDSASAIGGGGGACAPIKYLSGELPSSVAFTIAASSAGSSTTTGNLGNNSTFHTTTAYGAQAITGTNSGGIGGSAYVANILNTTNSAIGGAAQTTQQQAFFGGASGGTISGRSPTVYGGGGGGGIASSVVQPVYGTTVFGGVGGVAADTTNGGDGTAPGGGGGSTKTGTKGGDGARGELRLWGIV